MPTEEITPRWALLRYTIFLFQQFIDSFLYGGIIISGSGEPSFAFIAVAPVASDNLTCDGVNGFFLLFGAYRLALTVKDIVTLVLVSAFLCVAKVLKCTLLAVCVRPRFAHTVKRRA